MFGFVDFGVWSKIIHIETPSLMLGVRNKIGLSGTRRSSLPSMVYAQSLVFRYTSAARAVESQYTAQPADMYRKTSDCDIP